MGSKWTIEIVKEPWENKKNDSEKDVEGIKRPWGGRHGRERLIRGHWAFKWRARHAGEVSFPRVPSRVSSFEVRVSKNRVSSFGFRFSGCRMLA